MSTLGYIIAIILYQDVNVTIPCVSCRIVSVCTHYKPSKTESYRWHRFKRSAEVNKRRREDTARLEAAKSQVVQLCDIGNGEVTVNHTQG